MASRVYIKPDETDAGVILVDGHCYQRLEDSAQPPEDSLVIDEEHATCDECPNPCSCTGVDATLSGLTGYPCSLSNGTIYYLGSSDGSEYCLWSFRSGTAYGYSGDDHYANRMWVIYAKSACTFSPPEYGHSSIELSPGDWAIALHTDPLGTDPQGNDEWIEKTPGVKCMEGQLSGSHAFGSPDHVERCNQSPTVNF